MDRRLVPLAVAMALASASAYAETPLPDLSGLWEGPGFDLPMALGILGAMGVVTPPEDHLFIGELSLDGTLRPVRGALSIENIRVNVPSVFTVIGATSGRTDVPKLKPTMRCETG